MNWLRRILGYDTEALERIECAQGTIINLVGKLLAATQEETKLMQEILDKISAADTKLDAQAIVISDTKAEVDALKALVQSGADLSTIGAAVDALAARVDAHGAALDDLKTDAAPPTP